MSRWTAHVRSRIATGLFVLLPAALTVWLIVLIFRAIDRALAEQVLRLVGADHAPNVAMLWTSRALAVLAIFAALYVVGLVATNVVGRRLLGATEAGVRRLPVLGGVYGGFRQLLDGFKPGGGSIFRRAVLIEYPRRGCFRVAFVTNDQPRLVGDPPRRCIAVFVPQTPNPTSGFLVLLQVEECRPLGLSPEEGLKMIVSGGIVAPEKLPIDGAEFPAADGGEDDPA